MNVFVIDAYAVFAVVEYLQVEFSSVVKEIVVDVVPDDNCPDGEGLLLTGGVVSDGGELTNEYSSDISVGVKARL